MIRNDGAYKIYVIEAKSKEYKGGEWYTASLDHFGSPKGFSASGECWQRTSVYGTFDEVEARRGLAWIRGKHPDTKFRLTCVHIAQMKVPVQE